jgi:hypothetical protein
MNVIQPWIVEQFVEKAPDGTQVHHSFSPSTPSRPAIRRWHQGGSGPSPTSPCAKTPGGLGVNFIRVDQGHLAIGHLARAAFDFSGQKRVGIGIGAFAVQAGYEVMG